VALSVTNIYVCRMDHKHPNLIKIGKRIRQVRKDKGFSQEKLADAAAFGRTYMGRIERGEQNISIQNLIQLAIVLRTEVGEMIPPVNQLTSPKQRQKDQ